MGEQTPTKEECWTAFWQTIAVAYNDLPTSVRKECEQEQQQDS